MKLLLGATLFLGVFGACSSSTPKPQNMEASVQHFLSHLERQEYLKAQSYATASSAEILEDQHRSKPNFVVQSCQTKSEKEGFCVVKICYDMDGEKQCAQDTFNLKYEANSWRVDWQEKVESQMYRQEEALQEQLEQIKALKQLEQQANGVDQALEVDTAQTH
jgi:hypothetical protein